MCEKSVFVGFQGLKWKSNRFLIAVPKIRVISCYGFLEKPLVLFVNLLWLLHFGG
ncbi:hypothetical protein HanPSC8_Chr01g0005081 [Helianthus annuus]|nr:hypothetical protein HanPSC8_Chr01g0005081 [Helianthus annuus]